MNRHSDFIVPAIVCFLFRFLTDEELVMPNMSYCRFHNTLLDLQDCHNAIMEMIEATGDCEADCETLSRDELRAAQELAATAVRFLETLSEYTGRDCEDIFAAGQPENVFQDAITLINQELSECNGDEDDDC